MTLPKRPELAGLVPYRPGRRPPPAVGDGQAALRPIAKLSSNESAFSPLASVQDAIRAHVAEVHRYPDFYARDLGETLADFLDVGLDQLAVGGGSVALCRAVIEASTSKGDEVVMARPTFDMYERAALIAGARPIPVPLTPDLSHDLDGMAAAIGPRTSAIFVCNPNNPTGTAVDEDRMHKFADQVPKDVLLVVDEAYREFASNPSAIPDAVRLVADHENLVVLRTFSKAYGLADLRVGYAVGSQGFMGELGKVMLPFGVSTLAQVAAVASLRSGTELAPRVAQVVAERSRVAEALRACGFSVTDSEANFLWLPMGPAGEDFARACELEGVLIRPLPPDGARVTIGSREENDRFLDVAGKWSREVSDRAKK